MKPRLVRPGDNVPDIADRLEAAARAAVDRADEILMREAAGLIRRFDEAAAHVLSRADNEPPRLWALEILQAAATRHKRRAGNA